MRHLALIGKFELNIFISTGVRLPTVAIDRLDDLRVGRHSECIMILDKDWEKWEREGRPRRIVHLSSAVLK